VQQQGSDMINVTVPGAPSNNLVSLLTHASQMSVRPVYLEAPYVPPSAAKAVPVSYGGSNLVNAATLKLFDKEVCQPGGNAGTVNPSWQQTVGYSRAGDQWNALKSQIVSCDSSGTKYALGPAVYVGGDITSVTAGLQQNGAQWVVNLSLNGGAATRFGTLTASQYDSYYAGAHSGNADDQALDSTAVVLDGNVTSAEMTAEPIPAGNVQITGGGSAGFTQAQATDLADALKYGSLPLDFQLLNESTVSAQLGHSSLVAGLTSGIIGLSLVTIYLFAYYRGPGR
jgi:protein-export membrane protein SecD